MLRDGHDPKEINMTAFAKICSAAILSVALAALASSASAAQRAPVNGQAAEARATARQFLENCGNTPLAEFVVDALTQSTNSTTLVDVDRSFRSFTVGGNKPSCVIVRFSAQAFAPGIAEFMRVRALLDGKPSIENEIQLVAESVSFSDAHAYTFLFPSVPPGLHNVKMQYRSPNAGTVSINDFNLEIRHR
jgi:hypothetical protein